MSRIACEYCNQPTIGPADASSKAVTKHWSRSTTHPDKYTMRSPIVNPHWSQARALSPTRSGSAARTGLVRCGSGPRYDGGK